MIVEKGIKPGLEWFYEARFGLFIHFGLYALLGRGEWVMYHERIPRDEYVRLARRFNPERFDADEWVQLALDAGARYITVTAKHHDGFCLFDSALTEFKITRTPFGRDLIGELIAACHRKDMRIVLYYSQPDWNHPNYLHNRGAFKDLSDPPASDRPDWPAYVRYYMGQVEELCTKYGRIDGIWFDGSHKSVEEWQGRAVYDLIKRYQPHAVVNDRGRFGDFFTPERTLPENLTGYLFEACESVSPMAWGYKQDTASFSTPHLVRSLDKMNLAGGNYLLNVGPAPDGIIPAKQAQVLRSIGSWLKVSGSAVYRTEPVFLDMPREYGATRSGRNLFVHCLEWPDSDRLMLPGIETAVQSVRLLSGGSAVLFRQDAAGVELYNLPCLPPDPLVQVFELTFAEKPVIREKQFIEPVVPVTPVSRNGRTELPAAAAEFVGYGVKGARLTLQTDPAGGPDSIGGWWTPEQEAHWRITCPEAGAYRVGIEAGCPEGDGGPVIRITTAGGSLLADMPSIGADRAAVVVDAGTVELPAGESVIIVSPEKLKWGYLFGKVVRVILEG